MQYLPPMPALALCWRHLSSVARKNAEHGLAADTKAMREAAVMIPVWDDHEYTK